MDRGCNDLERWPWSGRESLRRKSRPEAGVDQLGGDLGLGLAQVMEPHRLHALTVQPSGITSLANGTERIPSPPVASLSRS